jgi:hypothetical protein
MKLSHFLAWLALLAQAASANAAAQIKPGAYRVDVNGKTRELCVDDIGNAELSARGWQQRLAEQGVRCTVQNAKRDSDATKRGALVTSWTATCSAPGMGKVYHTAYRVSVRVNADQSFELLTLLSGDLQAKILVAGQRLLEAGGSCTSQHETFRPWQ